MKAVKLGLVASLARATLDPADFPNEEFEYYSIPAFQDRGSPAVTRGFAIRSIKLLVNPDTVLFGKLNPDVPKIWRVQRTDGRRQIASTEFFALRPDAEVLDKDYLYFLCGSPHVLEKAIGLGRGSTPSRQRVDPHGFQDIMIPLPPLDEQRRIVRILSTIQRAVAVGGAHLEALSRMRVILRESILSQAAPQVRFADAVEIVSGQVDPRKEPYLSQPHVAPDNIESRTGRLFGIQLARELNLISGKYAFKNGDILYSKIRPYLVKAGIAVGNGTCSADMYVLRPRAGTLTPEYLVEQLLSRGFTSQATAHQGRTGIPKINRDQLGSVSLSAPSLDRQRGADIVLRAARRACLAAESGLDSRSNLFAAARFELLGRGQ